MADTANQSTIDPTRETVGSICNKAKSTNETVIAGDLGSELARSLVDDLNDTIASNPFEGRPFYITVEEKKNAQLKNAIERRLYKTLYRPYPEDNTVVFYVEPRSNTVKFCWCLPHHSEMDTILSNWNQFSKEFINDILAWKKFDLTHFGFETKKQDGKDVVIPLDRNRDKNLTSPDVHISLSN